jgi:hypothetical protein
MIRYPSIMVLYNESVERKYDFNILQTSINITYLYLLG